MPELVAALEFMTGLLFFLLGLPSQSTSPYRPGLEGCGRPSGRQLVWAMVFGVSVSVGLALLRHLSMPPIVRYLIPVVPVLTGARYMQVLVNDTRRQQDELQLRIYLE